MEKNKIVQELSNKRIVIDNKYYIMETSPMCPDPLPEPNVSYSKLGFQCIREGLKKWII